MEDGTYMPFINKGFVVCTINNLFVKNASICLFLKKKSSSHTQELSKRIKISRYKTPIFHYICTITRGSHNAFSLSYSTYWCVSITNSKIASAMISSANGAHLCAWHLGWKNLIHRNESDDNSKRGISQRKPAWFYQFEFPS